MSEILGHLTCIRRFPVKSMAGEVVPEVWVSYSGLAGDRGYAFRDQAKQNNFPWLTARQMPNLLQYQPTWKQVLQVETQYPQPEALELAITTPEGTTYSIEDSALLEHLQDCTSRPLVLRFSEAGMQDSRPVSLISQQTIKAFEQEMNMPMDERRFRMNFQVDWAQPIPFFEDTLVGKKIQIGDTLVLEINKKDHRCIMINLDPDDGQGNPLIFKTLAQNHEACLGVYAVIVKEGTVKENDSIIGLW